MENTYWCSIALSPKSVRAEVVHSGRGKFKIVNAQAESTEHNNKIIDASDILYCETEVSAPTEEKKYFESFCKEILSISQSIRFAAVANVIGSLTANVYRPGVVPLISKQEFSQNSIRAAIREDFESKIGLMKYLIGRYEKLIRAVIPLSETVGNAIKVNEKIDGSGRKRLFYLVLSFDPESDAESIIEDKVLPLTESGGSIPRIRE